MTVAPVVVKPEKASNMASVMDICGCSSSKNGKAPKLANTAQNSATIKKPSFALKSPRTPRLGYQNANPVNKHNKNARIKGSPLPSPKISEIIAGRIIVTLNNETNRPKIRMMERICISSDNLLAYRYC